MSNWNCPVNDAWCHDDDPCPNCRVEHFESLAVALAKQAAELRLRAKAAEQELAFTKQVLNGWQEKARYWQDRCQQRDAELQNAENKAEHFFKKWERFLDEVED